MGEKWKEEIIAEHKKRDKVCTNETHDGVDCDCMKEKTKLKPILDYVPEFNSKKEVEEK